MKKIIYILLALAVLSCGKVPVNGKLDGMWQLVEIQKANGQNEFPVKTYFMIQLDMLKLSRVHEGSLHGSKTDYYVGRFEFTKDSLSFYNIRIYRNENVAATENDLAPFGLNASMNRFAIEEMTNSNMALKSGEIKLIFRKF